VLLVVKIYLIIISDVFDYAQDFVEDVDISLLL
jgi:hypothetical protein